MIGDGKVMSSLGPREKLSKDSPYYKATDFRQLQIIRRRKEAAEKARERRDRLQQLADVKTISRSTVTIDTSKAKSNSEIVRICSEDLGWKEFPFCGRKDNCDVHWHAVSFQDNPDIYRGKVNKFPGAGPIFNKVNLFRCLDFMKTLFPNEYNFYPRTWFLPYQYNEFYAEARRLADKKSRPKPTYIVKPSDGSQGEGIYLLRDPQNYNYNGRSHVVQEYLTNVFLIDGYKFDLRIYVVLTKLEPAEFYICNEGLARFSTLPYENPTNKNLQETFMHLTNYSLNKKSSHFIKSEKDDEGSKRKLTSVLKALERMGHDAGTLWESIERIVSKTIIAVLSELKIERQAALHGKDSVSCFQIFGFDIILLKNLKPYLLEVNANPSMSIVGEQEVSPGVTQTVPSIKDEEVKYPLIRDTLLLVAPKHKYTRRKRHKWQSIHLRDSNSDQRDHVNSNETTIIVKEDDNMSDAITNSGARITRISLADFEKSVQTPNALIIRSESCDVSPRSKSELEMTDNGGTESDSSHDGTEQGTDDQPDEDDDQSCLKKIFPDIYGEEFKRFRLIEKLASMFLTALGLRGIQRLGPTGFRMFSRKCRLNRKGLTNATIDILYIDMQRKWDHMNPDRTSGLGFHGFLDACFEIARRKFYSPDRLEMFESFIDYCESNLCERQREEELKRKPPAVRTAHKLPKRTVHLFPRTTVTSLEEETVHNLFNHSMFRKLPTFVSPYDINQFISIKRTETYRPRSLKRLLKSGNGRE